MSNGIKRVGGTFAASILLAASLAAAPASAAKPPPPPTEDPDDPWYGCTPWGPVIYGVDCCDYPDLQIPCMEPDPPLDPVIIPLEAEAKSAGE